MSTLMLFVAFCLFSSVAASLATFFCIGLAFRVDVNNDFAREQFDVDCWLMFLVHMTVHRCDVS